MFKPLLSISFTERIVGMAFSKTRKATSITTRNCFNSIWIVTTPIDVLLPPILAMVRLLEGVID